MLHSLRRHYAQLVTSGAQLLLLFVGFHIGSRDGWLICLALSALISIPTWLSALKRLRVIRDTPTSRINSAAQGYVELVGRGVRFSDTPLVSKLRQLPCLWYRYRIEERTSENKWHLVDKGESLDSFVLRDGTGDCVIDPEHAEISTKHRDQWQESGYRYTEWKFIENDSLYVLGDFRTVQGSEGFDSREALNHLLAEWKRDMPALLKRFDLDHNGELDIDEWFLARQAAKREVAKLRREAEAQPDTHLIAQPRDGKLFLISNLTPEKLAQRYLFWSWAHLVIFFAALGGIGWTLGQ
jgi:hypothetical protein